MSDNPFDTKIGKLGFGFMRLPKKDGEFDSEQINKMVDLFLENGGTYFDTAYAYGGSEEALRKSLVERHGRESFQIATKLPIRMANDRAKLEEMYNTTAERLGAGYIDFYLLHGLNAKMSADGEKMGAWDYMRELKDAGKIKHMGFSFHGSAADLDEILTKHPEAEFVQLQINYLDWNSPKVDSKGVYEVARRHNKPISIMEPIKGGMLTGDNSPIAKLLHEANPEVSMASWALRFAAQLEGVYVVLSGMSALEHMTDNLKTFKDIKPLSDSETAILQQAVEIISSIPRIQCTSCGYCVKECPKKIMIPQLIDAYNNYLVYNTTNNVEHAYKIWTGHAGKASDCIECKACENACPQNLEIADTMKKLAELFD